MSTTTVLGRTGAAEWGRIWSVRSTLILVAATAVVVVGFGTIIGYDTEPNDVSPGSSAWDGGQLTGMFALFGVLAMAAVTSTADHATGAIVPTLQWTPRRGVLLAARVAVIAATTTMLAVALVAAASFVIWAFVPRLGLPVRDGAEVLGGLGFVYAAGALLAVGIGLFLRSTAGTLVTVIGLVLVLPMLLAQLPYEWSLTLAAHLPGSSALYLIFGEGPTEDMTTASARVTFASWAVGALVAGAWRLMRTDANR